MYPTSDQTQNTGKTNEKSASTDTRSLLTKDNASKSNAIDIPQISLPQGGGALKGIDEKFQVNPSNGTASFSIPLPLTPGRNGFSPELSLSYNSGGGNSPFGLGWSLQPPSILRKTDKKLPVYKNTEDVFMFSGAEDLVPLLERQTDDSWKAMEYSFGAYQVKQYRPRIEGGFTRIEQISHPARGMYWKVTNKENVSTLYGRSPDCCLADPEDSSRVYQWLPEFSYDDKGNWIKYEYKEENLQNVAHTFNERNRFNKLSPFTNRYLKRIRYGNRKAYFTDEQQPLDPPLPPDTSHMFELVLDYGEHHPDIPKPQEDSQRHWSSRPDAFSVYRPGFEIRTYRLCRRILMFHHFPDEENQDGSSFGKDCLVRSLDLEHEASSINDSGQTEVTYLKSLVQSGYIRQADGTYSKKSLPATEFDYQRLQWNTEVKDVGVKSLVHAPVGLSGNYQWTDLYGEGISGILSEQGNGWYYKRNLGDLNEDGQLALAQAETVAPKPSLMGLSNGLLSLQDLEARGEKQLVVNSPGLKGFFELAEDDNWKPFQSFTTPAHLNLADPNIRRLDLTGDGQPDLVMTEENVFVWYAADGKKGHKAAQYSPKPFDEEKGPALIFADNSKQESVYLADMTGDGLSDIVRLRNGEVCYWANKGYGKFSAKVTMDNAPLFDHPDAFNPASIQLADVSGTGVSDIIYLGKNNFKAYLNLSGNAWSDAHEIDPFFAVDQMVNLTVTDLLGTGTPCIVWSSPLPGDAGSPMRSIDLMDSRKPHVLTRYKNNLGKETSLEYKSSTYYYLKDQQAGRPWITKLPFPVQVIARTTVEDKITQVRFSTQYRYHHGYYDHQEREFRGFGMVEQTDTEFYESWKKDAQHSRLDKTAELYQAPVLTKTWFHTGAFLDRERILTHYKKEYWYEEFNRQFPHQILNITEPALKDGRLHSGRELNTQEWREALRACKGMILRKEIFALDGEQENEASMQKQAKPYTVATHTCHIQLLQPQGDQQHAVFMVTESEALNIQYERNEEDPRVAHSLNTKIDEMGNVLEAASVVYPRQKNALAGLKNQAIGLLYERPEEQQAYLQALDLLETEQQKTRVTYSRNRFTQDISNPNVYRLRLPAEAETFEITGLKPSEELFQLSDFSNLLDDPQAMRPYHEAADPNQVQYRLIEQVQSTYYNDKLNAEHLPGQHGRYGIPYQSYQLAWTPELLTDIYGNKLPADPPALVNLLSDNDQNTDGDDSYSQCRFVHRNDNNWWIRSGVPQFYREPGEDFETLKSRFLTPQAYLDPFGAQTHISYYKDYYMLIERTTDALGNQTTTERFNFRSLSPVRMRDLNDNLSEVVTDELGIVKAMAVMGKGNEADSIQGISEITTESERNEIRNYFTLSDTTALKASARNLLQNATSRFVYELDRYANSVELLEEQNRDNPEAGACEQIKLLPTVTASISRERHVAEVANDPNISESPLQLSFEYSDGMGNVAMQKVQAEPGEALQLDIQPDCSYSLRTVDTGTALRWIGNGRTVLNNKGKPVKQYEPYFSVNPFYEDHKELVERGVTPVIYYDAMGRNVRTELPDGTFTKIEFDSWHYKNFDPNDTVKDSRWYEKRINRQIDSELIAEGKNPSKEQHAAQKTGWHHNTPSVFYLDTLGRPVLSVEHNRILEKDALGNVTGAKDELYGTFLKLDAEGNLREVIDARGNPVMKYAYDILGHQHYENSMDAGESWVLTNVGGNPVLEWDSKGNIFAMAYDMLQRPLQKLLQTPGNSGQKLIEHFTYGESLSDAKKRNLHGQLFEYFDSSGKISNEAFDFHGQLLSSQRQLAAAFDQEIIDWSSGSPTNRLETESYTSITAYDALGRMSRMYNWHRRGDRISVYEPDYNERGLLVAEDKVTAAEKTAQGYSGGRRVTAVSEITYDEKGQRQHIKYGNGTVSRYHYDSKNFRLIQLRTVKRPAAQELPTAPSNLSDANVLQNLYYTYDPSGNICEIEDDAYETVFFNNQRVEPKSRYSYDALYRLIQAEGRENNTFNAAPSAKERNPLEISFPQTDQSLRNYTQTYRYDAVGNMLRMRHNASDAQRWTRDYAYEQDNNRLQSTDVGSHTVIYQYDAHGNMRNFNQTSEAYLPQWDYLDRVHRINLAGGGTAYYQYGADLERSRKRIEKAGGIVEERLYLGGMEIYRRWQGSELLEEIETEHLFVEEQRALITENVLQTDNGQLNTGIMDRYQYSNHLGSVGLEMNEHAEIISYEEYHPYGTTAYQAVNASVKATSKRYRYTGMERDEESGLSYHSARYYLPWLGRWLSADPIGIEDGVNVFVYGQNNPLAFKDERGTQAGRGGYNQRTIRTPNQLQRANRANRSSARRSLRRSSTSQSTRSRRQEQIRVRRQRNRDREQLREQFRQFRNELDAMLGTGHTSNGIPGQSARPLPNRPIRGQDKFSRVLQGFLHLLGANQNARNKRQVRSFDNQKNNPSVIFLSGKTLIERDISLDNEIENLAEVANENDKLYALKFNSDIVAISLNEKKLKELAKDGFHVELNEDGTAVLREQVRISNEFAPIIAETAKREIYSRLSKALNDTINYDGNENAEVPKSVSGFIENVDRIISGLNPKAQEILFNSLESELGAENARILIGKPNNYSMNPFLSKEQIISSQD